MSSFRDPLNPESIRFPGSLVTKTLIGFGLFIILATLILVIFFGSGWISKGIDAALLLAASILMLNWWPGEIVTDQRGVHLNGFFGRVRKDIPWKDVDQAEPASEFGASLASSLKLRTDTLEIRSRNAGQCIIHTPRHGDRNRLLREIKMRSVQTQDSLPGPARR